jgi:hypothetical protein
LCVGSNFSLRANVNMGNKASTVSTFS